MRPAPRDRTPETLERWLESWGPRCPHQWEPLYAVDPNADWNRPGAAVVAGRYCRLCAAQELV